MFQHKAKFLNSRLEYLQIRIEKVLFTPCQLITYENLRIDPLPEFNGHAWQTSLPIFFNQLKLY